MIYLDRCGREPRLVKRKDDRVSEVERDKKLLGQEWEKLGVSSDRVDQGTISLWICPGNERCDIHPEAWDAEE
jgi:hypothetical protein